MRRTLAVLSAAPLAGVLCTGCGVSDHIADLSSDHAECFHTGDAVSNGPFTVAIKRLHNPAVPMLNYQPAKHKAGALSTTVRLTNASARVVTVQNDLSGYLIDAESQVASAAPDAETAAGNRLVPLKPGRSTTIPVTVWVERCNTKPGRSPAAGHYRLRVQIIYISGKPTSRGKVKTIDSTTTVPVVLR